MDNRTPDEDKSLSASEKYEDVDLNKYGFDDSIPVWNSSDPDNMINSILISINKSDDKDDWLKEFKLDESEGDAIKRIIPLATAYAMPLPIVYAVPPPDPAQLLMDAIIANNAVKVGELIEAKAIISPAAWDHAILHDKTGAIIKQLLDAKVDPNVQDIHGQTPLMRILREAPPSVKRSLSERKAIVEMFLDVGARLDLATKQSGLTAFDLAVMHGRVDEAEIIRAEMAKKSPPSSEYTAYLAKHRLMKKTVHAQGLGDDKSTIPLSYPGGEAVDYVKLEGHPSHLILPNLINYLKRFRDKVSADEIKEEKKLTPAETPSFMFGQIIASLETSSNFANLNMTGEDFAAYYQTSDLVILPIVINVDVHGVMLPHGIGVAFDKSGKGDNDDSYLVYCNRGGGARKELGIYRITKAEQAVLDSKLANPDLWKKFFTQGGMADADFSAFLAEHIASFRAGTPEFRLKPKDQKHGTCAFVNVKALVEALLFLSMLHNSRSKRSSADPEKYLLIAKQLYKEFTAHMRDTDLDELITEFKINRDPFLLDLFKLIVNEHHGAERSDKRAEKIAGELSRLLKILNNLSDAERRQVVTRQNIEALFRACKNNSEIMSILNPIAQDIYKHDFWSHIQLYEKTNIPFSTDMITRWNKNLEEHNRISPIPYRSLWKAINDGCGPAWIETLIKSGEDPRLADESKRTPLQHLITSRPPGGEKYAIAEVLLKHGADPNITIGDSNLLSHLATYGDTSLAILLLRHGADPLAPTATGKDAFTIAIEKNNWDLFTLMLMTMDAKSLKKIDPSIRSFLQANQSSLVDMAIRLLSYLPDRDKLLSDIKSEKSAFSELLKLSHTPTAAPSTLFAATPATNPYLDRLIAAFPEEKKAVEHKPTILPPPATLSSSD